MRLFEWIIALSSIGMLWHVIWSRKQLKGPALKIFSLLTITCIVLLPDRECESSIRQYPDIRFKKGN